MREKFETLFIVKSSLISLYLALTIPIPFITNNYLKTLSIVSFLLGLFIILEITNDYVKTCENKITYKTGFFSKIFGKKNWEISWEDIQQIKSFPTSQGSKIHYFVSNKDELFLVPQRIDNLEEFLEIISEKTGFNLDTLSYISPLWTYKLLTIISVMMVIGELIALKFIYYQY